MADRFEYKNGIWREKTPVWMAGEVANSAGSSNRMYSPGPDDPCPDCVQEKRTALAAQYVGGAARQFEEEKARTTQRVQQTALKTGLRKVPFHQAAFDLVTETKKQAGEEEAASIYSGFSEGEKAGLGRVDSPLELDWPGCSGLYPETSFEAFNCACGVLAALRELSPQNAQYWNEAVQALDDMMPWKICELDDYFDDIGQPELASASSYLATPPIPPPPPLWGASSSVFTLFPISSLPFKEVSNVGFVVVGPSANEPLTWFMQWWPQVEVNTDGSDDSQTLVELLHWFVKRGWQLRFLEIDSAAPGLGLWQAVVDVHGAEAPWFYFYHSWLRASYHGQLLQMQSNNPIRAAYVERIADNGPLLELIDTSPCEEKEIEEPTVQCEVTPEMSGTKTYWAILAVQFLTQVLDNCETEITPDTPLAITFALSTHVISTSVMDNDADAVKVFCVTWNTVHLMYETEACTLHIKTPCTDSVLDCVDAYRDAVAEFQDAAGDEIWTDNSKMGIWVNSGNPLAMVSYP